MKKKLFFKLFLFAVIGAFVTVTSCKDYDDDINNLQEQIEKLASKDDLTSQLSTLQSAVTAAQTAANNAATKADQALAAAQAIGDVEAIAKAEAEAAAAAVKVETLAELATQIEDLKAELAAANEAEFEAIKEELNTKLDEISEKAENALSLIAGAVFDVELIPAFSTTTSFAPSLTFSTAYEKANVFEEGVANAITFVKDAQVQTGDFFVIRVSPTNVIVTPEMITIQNSKGVTYDNLKVTKVEPFDGLITRSTNGAGLWKVYVELENYGAATFKAATEVAGTSPLKKVLFAVAINNTDEDAPSKVISSYDIELNWAAYTPANRLYYFVADKHVKDVNNRYDNTSVSLDAATGTLYTEKEWLGAPAVAATTTNVASSSTSDDDRTALQAYPAVQGQPIKISLTQALTDTKATAPSNIRAMYVTLDYQTNAIESAPSEWNAWNSYSYNGLGTVVDGTETEIIINSTSAINDFIGFRVFAVNYDGTLVDPDGKAFYVSIGQQSANWSAINTIITATASTLKGGAAPTTAKSALANASLTKLTGATAYEWTTDNTEAVSGGPAATKPAFHVYIVENNGTTAVFNTSAATGSVASSVDFSKGVKVYTMPAVSDWLAYKDGKVYNGKLTIKNATGHVLATLDVTFKKELPIVPAGFSVKTNQVVNGVYNAYLVPNTWTAPNATAGTMSLDQVFNWGTGTLANFETTFASSTYDTSTPPKLVTASFTGNGPLSVAKSFIDNSTQHATKVVYNYGLISTETKNNSGTIIDYKVTVEEFQTVYSNIYNSTYSWNWATRAQLNTSLNAVADGDDYTAMTSGNYNLAMPYSTEVTYGNTETFDLGWIFGTSTRDSKYNANLDAPYVGTTPSLNIQSVKLISNANGLDEYFTATLSTTGTASAPAFTLAEKSGSTNPTADVASTLVIEALDMYGNDVVIELPMTVKKR